MTKAEAGRFLAVDWGTTRLRALLVEDGAVLDRAESDAGISRVAPGGHAAAFEALCGAWLAAEPALPVALVGMVGSREGWVAAPYAACPAGPDEIAAALTALDLGAGRRGVVVPGVRADDPDGVDVMRGEETHLLGSGVVDGIVALPGTHCKWAEMRAGRIVRFATFVTGELHGLLRTHSMIGRPATEPADPAGVSAGFAAADREGSLLNALFRARAATVTGGLSPAALGPYLSGLLTGHEVGAALRMFGSPGRVTVVADPARAELYREALARRGIASDTIAPELSLIAGLSRILEAAGIRARSRQPARSS